MTVSTKWLLPDRVFDGATLRDDMAVAVAGDRVTKIARRQDLPKGATPARLDGILSPGFVDLQVNGGGDVLFNQDPTRAGLEKIAAAHRTFGTVRFLPTVITDAPDVMAQAVDTVLGTRDLPEILGLHIEGPHISENRRGTHASRFIRPMDDTTIGHVRRLRHKDIPVMITVAPEAVSDAQIAALTALGAVVSIGHSDATAEQVRAALAAGARCFTHLFNAMSPMENRAAGVVGAAINSEAFAGIICDGIHVADEMVGLAIRARPVPNRMFLVSDAMPTVGGRGYFDLYGSRIELKCGRLINEEGSLAGAHTTMIGSLRHLVKDVGVELETALRMASGTPFELLRPSTATPPLLFSMALSDILLLDPDLTSPQSLSKLCA